MPRLLSARSARMALVPSRPVSTRRRRARPTPSTGSRLVVSSRIWELPAWSTCDGVDALWSGAPAAGAPPAPIRRSAEPAHGGNRITHGEQPLNVERRGGDREAALSLGSGATGNRGGREPYLPLA